MKLVSWFYKNDDRIIRLINTCQGCSLFYAQYILWILSYVSLLFLQINSSFSEDPVFRIALTCVATWIGLMTLRTLWISHSAQVYLSKTDATPESARECQKCKIYNKSENDHHCFLCNRCVRGMDHHCLFINNCVGSSNHKAFLGFLIYSILSSILFFFYDGFQFYNLYLVAPRIKVSSWFFWLVLQLFLSALILMGVGFLLFSQLQCFAMGLTMVELKHSLKDSEITTSYFLAHPIQWCKRAKKGMYSILRVNSPFDLLLQ